MEFTIAACWMCVSATASSRILENFKYAFDKALEGKFIDRMDQNQEMFARLPRESAT